MDKNDLEHHFRIIDMMLTMHSTLRDRLRRRAFAAYLLLLGSSMILCIAQFTNPDLLTKLHIDPSTAQIAGGICSVCVLLISLAVVMLDWGKKAERHSQAVGELSRLKAQCREVLKTDVSTFSDERCQALSRECAWALQCTEKVPDRKFNKLKALHKRKIELSKLADAHPGCPFLLIQVKLLYLCIRGIFKPDGSSEGDDKNE